MNALRSLLISNLEGVINRTEIEQCISSLSEINEISKDVIHIIEQIINTDPCNIDNKTLLMHFVELKSKLYGKLDKQYEQAKRFLRVITDETLVEDETNDACNNQNDMGRLNREKLCSREHILCNIYKAVMGKDANEGDARWFKNYILELFSRSQCVIKDIDSISNVNSPYSNQEANEIEESLFRIYVQIDIELSDWIIHLKKPIELLIDKLNK